MSDKYVLVGREPVAEHDLFAWGEWFERAERRVAVTLLRGVEVSTVFLGLDHSWSGVRPLLFETMAFQQANSPAAAALVDLVGQPRCSTWAEAEAQHERALAEVRAWKEPTMTDTETPPSRGGREFDAATPRLGRIVLALFSIATAIGFLSRKVHRMTTAVEDLTAAVEAEGTVVQSAVTLITGLLDQVQANKNDPDAIEAVVAKVRGQTAALAAAIPAGTPAASVPVADPDATANAAAGASTSAGPTSADAPSADAPAPATDATTGS